LHVSKEVARQFYMKLKWYVDVLQAKEEARERGTEDWKALCRSQPTRLDPTLRRIISQMYQATTNECTGLRLFEVPPLSRVVEDYKEYLKNSS
jgi:hypothetical protein